MKLTKLSLAMVGCASMVAGVAHAAGPTLSDVLGNSGITESGFIDAAYTSLNANDPLNPFSGGNPSTFNVQQAGIQLAKQPSSGFGGLLNLTMGSDASVIHSYGATNGSSSNVDVTQAFVQYASGAWTTIAGKYTTLAGAEVIAPTGNTNITRSIAFFQVPFTHTGIREAWAPTSTVTVYAGLNNGWDDAQASTKGKTGELGVAWNPNAVVSLAVQGYYGTQLASEDAANPSPAAAQGTRSVIDAVLTIKPTSSLTLILNADSGSQDKAYTDASGAVKNASWSDLVGYVNYQWTDKWRTSLRAEEFNDQDGYKLGLSYTDPVTSVTAINKSVDEVTLTVGYAPDPSFELRAEVREDKADKKAFAEFDTTKTPTDSITTLALEGLYKF